MDFGNFLLEWSSSMETTMLGWICGANVILFDFPNGKSTRNTFGIHWECVSLMFNHQPSEVSGEYSVFEK